MPWNDREPTRIGQPLGVGDILERAPVQRPVLRLDPDPYGYQEEAPMPSKREQDADFEKWLNSPAPQPPPPAPTDEMAQFAAARDLLNRGAADGKIGLHVTHAADFGKLQVSRPEPRTVIDWVDL